MSGEARRILLIEDDHAQAVLLRENLLRAFPDQFEIALAETLREAFAKFSCSFVDAILLDLSLPDSMGLQTIDKAAAAFSSTPIVVLTGQNDEQLAVEAVRRGAQDYLIKAEADGRMIARAICYAIQRKQAEESLRQARDELEQKIKERTTELSQSVAKLMGEVARRAAAEQALRERSDRLRELASEVTLAEHRERHRLGLVLHDGLQQLLVGASYQLGSLERTKDKDVQRTVAEVSRLISSSIEMSRSLTAELSPPILLAGGLGPALQWLACWMKEKHGLAVELEASDEADGVSEDVSILLFQATRELLFNVVKHAGVKKAAVQIVRENNEVKVTVADEGSGFTTRGEAEGTNAVGLGLFSVRERLDYFGGRMEVDTTPGHGCRITLRAPFRSDLEEAPASTSKASARAPCTGSSPAAARSSGKTRVVLVDDHAVMRQGLAALLADEQDLEIVGEASDGQAALDLARAVRPDAMLMDINMPVMNGIEATRLIHAEMPDIRIIGLSMFDEVEQAAAMRSAGAVHYMSKSAPARSVVAAIRALVGGGNLPPR
jgi:DNA-binding NarL/FixJ family response regulator/anti-sigma regulatory factor (Ser/Thr protein kinase)